MADTDKTIETTEAAERRRYTLLSWMVPRSCCAYHAIKAAAALDDFVVKGVVPSEAEVANVMDGEKCDDALFTAEPAGSA